MQRSDPDKTSKTQLDDVASRHYDDHADDPAFSVENTVHSELAEVLKTSLAGARNVLDLGYGTGRKAEHLAQGSWRLSIVEGSRQLAETAERVLPPEVTVYNALFEEFDPPEKYDAIVASHVLEHLDEPGQILERMGTWLQESGRVFIVVPNAESIHRQVAARIGIQKHMSDFSPTDLRVQHRRVYNLVSLQQDVVDAGFVVERVFGCFLKIATNGMLSSLPENVIRGLCGISDVVPPNLLANIGVVARLKVPSS